MKIAALLPHLEVFGGVRRYLEIGDELVKRGHSFVLFHPQGTKPDWLDFIGVTMPFSSLEEDAFDIGLCSEFSILPYFNELKAKAKFFYFILQGHKKEKEVCKKKYYFLGNSEGICRRLERKYKISCFRAPGGINPEIFYPLDSKAKKEGFHILCFGRIYKRRKGIQYIIKAANSLYRKYPQLRLIFFDSLVGQDKKGPHPLVKTPIPFDFYLNLPQSQMARLYSQADIFVSAEIRAGWSNTTAEAMACRLPVVCTRQGTRDFAFHNQTALVVPFPFPFLLRRQIEKLIEDKELRLRLAEAGYKKIQEFSWSALASRLEIIFQSVLG